MDRVNSKPLKKIKQIGMYPLVYAAPCDLRFGAELWNSVVLV